MQTTISKRWEHYLAGIMGGLISQITGAIFTKFNYPVTLYYLIGGGLAGFLVGFLIERWINKTSNPVGKFFSIAITVIISAIISISILFAPILIICGILSIPLHITSFLICIIPSLTIYYATKKTLQYFWNLSSMQTIIISLVPTTFVSIATILLTYYFDNSYLDNIWIFDLRGYLLPFFWIIISWLIWEFPKSIRIIFKPFINFLAIIILNTLYIAWIGLSYFAF